MVGTPRRAARDPCRPSTRTHAITVALCTSSGPGAQRSCPSQPPSRRQRTIAAQGPLRSSEAEARAQGNSPGVRGDSHARLGSGSRAPRRGRRRGRPPNHPRFSSARAGPPGTTTRQDVGFEDGSPLDMNLLTVVFTLKAQSARSRRDRPRPRRAGGASLRRPFAWRERSIRSVARVRPVPGRQRPSRRRRRNRCRRGLARQRARISRRPWRRCRGLRHRRRPDVPSCQDDGPSRTGAHRRCYLASSHRSLPTGCFRAT